MRASYELILISVVCSKSELLNNEHLAIYPHSKSRRAAQYHTTSKSSALEILSMSSTIPRMHSHPNPYASTAYPQSTTSSTYGGGSGGGGGNFYSTRRDSYGYPTSTRGSGFPRLFKRLFKFPQMDFEVAIWEMTHLMVAPRKVFRNLYYQRRTFSSA